MIVTEVVAFRRRQQRSLLRAPLAEHLRRAGPARRHRRRLRPALLGDQRHLLGRGWLAADGCGHGATTPNFAAWAERNLRAAAREKLRSRPRCRGISPTRS